MRQTAIVVILSALLLPQQGETQATPRLVEPLLEFPLHSPQIVDFQIRQYALKSVPKLVVPRTSEQWHEEAGQLRKRLLDEVVFRGWPDEWCNSPLKFEDLGYLPSGKGYRMRKLRYEIVPGMQTTAILYEPEQLKGRVPAMLDVNGHAPEGKAVEYKQKRCINQALQGMLALSPEWFYMGELRQPDNTHWFSAHVDLTGISSLGLFYLAMRKGLDYLYQHPNVDRKRIGMTGVSGGGWQTIVLSGLDERVRLAIPVAGYASAELVGGNDKFGDNESSPTDFFSIADFLHVSAMVAPRPMLLINNAEDSCCFRAPIVKPFLFDRVRPFFHLYSADDRFAWHENLDPGDHNYQLDNRLAAYRFIAKHFGLRPVEREIPVDDQVRSVEDLSVGLPKDNLTLLSFAKKMASQIRRSPAPAEGAARLAWQKQESDKLAQLLRLKPVQVERAWMLTNSKSKGLESNSYRLDFTNGLSATGVRLKAIAIAEPRSATVILNDDGRKASAELVSERINRGECVLSLDVVLVGDAVPPRRWPWLYDRIFSSLGDRSLGIQAAQLLAVVRWMQAESPAIGNIRIESTGMRNQLAALAAAGLHPGYFSELVIRQGLPSLAALLDVPVPYDKIPDIFCFGLYREFDLDRLAEVAKPTTYSLVSRWAGLSAKTKAQ